MNTMTLQEIRKEQTILIPSNHVSGIDEIWIQPCHDDRPHDYIYKGDEYYDDISSVREFFERFALSYVYLTIADALQEKNAYTINFQDDEDVRFQQECQQKYELIQQQKELKTKEEKERIKKQKQREEKERIQSMSLYTLTEEHGKCYVYYDQKIRSLSLYGEQSEDEPETLHSSYDVWEDEVSPRDVELCGVYSEEVLSFFQQCNYIYLTKEDAEKQIHRIKVIE